MRGPDFTSPGPVTATKPRRTRRRAPRVLLALLGAGIAIILILAIFLPAIAGPIARGYVVDAIDRGIPGSVAIDQIGLSWRGPQALGPLTLRDPQGQEVAVIEATSTAGLVGFLRGNFDLGTTTIRGRAHVIAARDGTTNLGRALGLPPQVGGPPRREREPAPPAEEVEIPTSLRGKLVLDRVEVAYTDDRLARPGGAAATLALSEFSGTAALDARGPITIDLSGRASYTEGAAAGDAAPGTIAIAARVDDWTDASGLVTPDRARIDARVDATAVPVALLDVLAAQEGRLLAAVGERADVRATVKGAAADLAAEVVASSPTLDADLAVRYTATEIVLARPATFRARGDAFIHLAPAAQAALSEGPVVVGGYPDLGLTVESLRLPLPREGDAMDFRGGRISATLRASETTGRITLDGPDAGGGPRDLRIAPLELTIRSDDLAGPLTVRGGAVATIDGRNAGELALELTGNNLPALAGVSEAGPGEPPAMDGVVALTGFETQIAQPLVEGMGLRLPQDVGPRADLRVTARAVPTAGQEIPQTELEFGLRAANLNAEATLAIEGGTLTTTGEGIALSMAAAGPLANRMLAAHGVEIGTDTPLRLTVQALVLDLARAMQDPAPDLRRTTGAVTLWLGEAAGTAVLAAGEPPRPWRLSETTTTIETRNLAGSVAIRTSAEADLDGRPAGSLKVTLGLGGLLDRRGAPRAMPIGPHGGRIVASNLSTDLVQSFLPAAMLEGGEVRLAEALGPVANLDLRLEARRAESEAEAVPPTDIQLAITSQRMRGEGAWSIEAGTLRTRGEPFRLTLAAPAPGLLLGGLLPPDAGYTVAPGGTLALTLADVGVPLEAEAGLLATTRATLRADLNNLVIRSIATVEGEKPPPPVRVEAATLGAQLSPGEPPRLTLDSRLAHGGQAATAKADIRLVDLFTPGPDGAMEVTPAAARPTGSITLTDLPTALVALVPRGDSVREGPGTREAPIDLARLVGEALGPTVSANVTMQPVAGGRDPSAVNYRVTAESPRANLSTSARLGETGLTLGETKLAAQVTPGLVGTLAAGFAPDFDPPPTLREAARFEARVAGTRVPRTAEGALDFARAGDLSFNIGIADDLVLQGLTTLEEDGTRRDLGPMGVRALTASGTLPLGAFVEGGRGAQLDAKVAGRLIGAQGATGSLDGEIAARIENGSPLGPVQARFAVRDLASAWLDLLANNPGFVSGAVGDTLSLDLTLNGAFAPASEGEPGVTFRDGSVTAQAEAERLRMPNPATIAVHPDRFVLTQPATLRLTAVPAWANRFLLGEEGGDAAAPPAARFAAPMDLTINLSRLVTSRAADGEGGPMRPGVFDLAARATIPAARMVVGEGTPAGFSDIQLDTSAGQQPGSIGFRLLMVERSPDAGTHPAAESQQIRFAGGLYGLADETGALTAENAAITARGTAPNVTTAVIDALARQNGLLVELLGPTVSAEVELGGFSRTSGRISAQAKSPRASASIRGDVREGVLVTSEPAAVEVREFTPALAGRMLGGLPMLATLEKRPDDPPARITAADLSAPLDGDLRRLSGDVTIDLGTARFRTTDAFGALLATLDQRQAGEIGRSVAPLQIRIRNGVASYDKWSLPIGEFSLATSGQVNLVDRTLDVLTYIPFGALSQEAAGALNTDLASALGGAAELLDAGTMVPWRTRGSLTSPRTEPALDLFAQELGRGLLKPGGLIERGIEDILRPRRREEPR